MRYSGAKMPAHEFTKKHAEEIRRAIKTPEGRIAFEYSSNDLFNTSAVAKRLDFPSDNHLIRLERTPDLLLHYYHSSLGTGTRIATLDLKEITPCEEVLIVCTWSGEEISLMVVPRVEGARKHTAKGEVSKKQLRVGRDGGIYEIGGEGVEVRGVQVYRGGEPILMPTALEFWKETLKMTEVLATGTSSQGFIHDVAVANVTLSVLVSGFEVYTSRRFLELELEGRTPDIEAVINRFYSTHERESGIADSRKKDAAEAGVSTLAYIVKRRDINFQNYDECKRAFNKAYGISFGAIGVDSQTLGQLKRFIKYRHKIVHSEPLAIIYDMSAHPSEFIHASLEVAKQARECFDLFICKLHDITV